MSKTLGATASQGMTSMVSQRLNQSNQWNQSEQLIVPLLVPTPILTIKTTSRNAIWPPVLSHGTEIKIAKLQGRPPGFLEGLKIKQPGNQTGEAHV